MEMMSQDITGISKALSVFQGQMGTIPKTKAAKIPTKSGGSYTYYYADLADIQEVIRTPLAENGISYTQVFHENENKMFLNTILMHSSGGWLKSSLVMNLEKEVASKEGSFSVVRKTTQEIGSEITYLRRYALCSALGIVADEDDDGASSTAADRGTPKISTTFTPKYAEKTVDKPQDKISKDEIRMLQNALAGHLDIEKAFKEGGKIAQLGDLEAHRFEGALEWIDEKKAKKAERAS